MGAGEERNLGQQDRVPSVHVGFAPLQSTKCLRDHDTIILHVIASS